MVASMEAGASQESSRAAACVASTLLPSAQLALTAGQALACQGRQEHTQRRCQEGGNSPTGWESVVSTLPMGKSSSCRRRLPAQAKITGCAVDRMSPLATACQQNGESRARAPMAAQETEGGCSFHGTFAAGECPRARECLKAASLDSQAKSDSIGMREAPLQMSSEQCPVTQVNFLPGPQWADELEFADSDTNSGLLPLLEASMQLELQGQGLSKACFEAAKDTQDPSEACFQSTEDKQDLSKAWFGQTTQNREYPSNACSELTQNKGDPSKASSSRVGTPRLRRGQLRLDPWGLQGSTAVGSVGSVGPTAPMRPHCVGTPHSTAPAQGKGVWASAQEPNSPSASRTVRVAQPPRESWCERSGWPADEDARKEQCSLPQNDNCSPGSGQSMEPSDGSGKEPGQFHWNGSASVIGHPGSSSLGSLRRGLQSHSFPTAQHSVAQHQRYSSLDGLPLANGETLLAPVLSKALRSSNEAQGTSLLSLEQAWTESRPDLKQSKEEDSSPSSSHLTSVKASSGFLPSSVDYNSNLPLAALSNGFVPSSRPSADVLGGSICRAGQVQSPVWPPLKSALKGSKHHRAASADVSQATSADVTQASKTMGSMSPRLMGSRDFEAVASNDESVDVESMVKMQRPRRRVQFNSTVRVRVCRVTSTFA